MPDVLRLTTGHIIIIMLIPNSYTFFCNCYILQSSGRTDPYENVLISFTNIIFSLEVLIWERSRLLPRKLSILHEGLEVVSAFLHQISVINEFSSFFHKNSTSLWFKSELYNYWINTAIDNMIIPPFTQQVVSFTIKHLIFFVVLM